MQSVHIMSAYDEELKYLSKRIAAMGGFGSGKPSPVIGFNDDAAWRRNGCIGPASR